MTEASQFAKPRDRWANELWNLSLLPVTSARSAEFPRNVGVAREPRVTRVQSLDVARLAKVPLVSALRLMHTLSGDTLGR